jgi:hypothetical protein
MDDELRLIIETAVPFAIPATIQLMLFVYFTNISKNVRKWVFNQLLQLLNLVDINLTGM